MTEYQYDISNYGDNLVAVIDAEGRKRGYEYDAWGRLTKENVYTGTNPWYLDDYIEYTYDTSMGEYLDYKVDMNGNKTEYEYYAPGFIRSTTWYTGLSTYWGDIEYEYNAGGQLISITTDGGDCDCGSRYKTMQYNANGQIVNQLGAFGSAFIEYGYDGIGRLNEIKTPNTAGDYGTSLNTHNFGYDAANRVVNVTAALHNNATLGYNEANQLTSIDFVSDYGVGYSYNQATGRLTSITYDTDGGDDRLLTYGYNSDGLRTSAQWKAGNVTSPAISYEYDDLNRLTKESYAGVAAGTCIVLGGTGEVTIDAGGDLAKSLTGITVDMRVYVDALPQSEGVLFERGADGSENWLKFYIDSSGNLKATVETDLDEDTASIGPLPVDRWVHVMCSYTDGGTLKVGINACDFETVEMESGGEIGAFSGDPKIGTGFIGKIDEVHVRKTAAVAFSLSENYEPDANTIGLWHFDEGSGTTSAEDDPVEARYVRIWTDYLYCYSPTQYRLDVMEMQVYDDTPTNIALGDDTACSSYASAPYNSDNLTDGELTNIDTGRFCTTMRTQCCANTEWCYVDLGSSEEFETVEVVWRPNGAPGAPHHWILQTSENASTWLDVREFSSYDPGTGEETETIDVHQNATLDAGVSWSNNDGDTGVGSYSREYTYDKVGNRTFMTLVDDDGSVDRDITWKMDYNDLNQLTKRYVDPWATGSSGEERWEYAFDANGNLVAATQETSNGSTWSETLRWDYEWNPRDQMSKASKYVNGSLDGYVEYEYCLSCDGALSKRLQYDDSADLEMAWRYECDGLNLLRMDEVYDSTGDGDLANDLARDNWRIRETNTHRPRLRIVPFVVRHKFPLVFSGRKTESTMTSKTQAGSGLGFAPIDRISPCTADGESGESTLSPWEDPPAGEAGSSSRRPGTGQFTRYMRANRLRGGSRSRRASLHRDGNRGRELPSGSSGVALRSVQTAPEGFPHSFPDSQPGPRQGQIGESPGLCHSRAVRRDRLPIS